MSWFCVPCYFERISPGDNVEPLFEECIYMINASVPEDATLLAINLAKKQETSYIPIVGKSVSWIFVASGYPFELPGEPGEDLEVYSRHLGQTAFRALMDIS